MSLFFMITSILMVVYFFEYAEEESDDVSLFYIRFYGISIFIFLFIAVYSLYGLKGKSRKIVESSIAVGVILSAEFGFFIFYLGLPFFILIDIEDLGYYQRLMIMFLFLSFWIVVLYFILKITHYKKPKRKGY
jgi:hypothetical protein